MSLIKDVRPIVFFEEQMLAEDTNPFIQLIKNRITAPSAWANAYAEAVTPLIASNQMGAALTAVGVTAVNEFALVMTLPPNWLFVHLRDGLQFHGGNKVAVFESEKSFLIFSGRFPEWSVCWEGGRDE